MTEMTELELPIHHNTIYKTNCGCTVEIINRLDNRGKHMKSFFMGCIIACCPDHQGLKNVRNKWRLNGQHKGIHNADKNNQALDLWHKIERDGSHPAPLR